MTTGLPGSPTTTSTVYVGNVEEIATTGSTTTTTAYYYAGEMRIALAVNGVFSYLATDALGSTTIAFDANGLPTATTLYAPYGGVRYTNGVMPTDYGFTGQHSDTATGLDYYGARYYDPLAAQFAQADTMLPGDGMDPWGLSRYAYVEGNPLIRVDRTGHDGGWLGGLVSSVTSTVSSAVSTVAPIVSAVAPAAVAVLDATTGIPSMINDVKTIFSGNSSMLDKIMAGGDILLNVAMDVSMVVGVGEGLRVAYVGAKIAGHVAMDAGEHAAEHEAEDFAEHAARGCAMSFAASTLVLTPTGERAFASLKTGDTGTAYDPRTGKTSLQTVEATSIHHDANLVDVTLNVTTAVPTAAKTSASKVAPTHTHTEVVHTTANHPWLSADHGWLIASFLQVGEPVRQADGSTATVVAVRSVSGAADMWDLTVSQAHTFAVGAGQFVVHNACGPVKAGDSGRYGDLMAQARKYGRDGNLEFHHMPSKGLFGVTKDDGWAIAVEDWEHGETRSFRWRGRGSRAIDRAGTLKQAYMRDANDLRLVTFTKYDDAIYKGFQYYQRLGLW